MVSFMGATWGCLRFLPHSWPKRDCKINIYSAVTMCHEVFQVLHRYWTFYFFFKRVYLFILRERGEGREKVKERNISVWLLLPHPLLGTWPATQACALTGNRTEDLLVHRPALNPLSHTSQGWTVFLYLTVTHKQRHKQILICNYLLLHRFPNSSLTGQFPLENLFPIMTS